MLLCGGYFISAFGDSLNDNGQLAMMDALQSDRSTRLMALMLFGLFAPFFILGPVAGFAADRLGRRRVMIAADITRAFIVLSFTPLIPWLLANSAGDYTVMFTQMMLGSLAVFFSPARQALVPVLVRPDQLVRANAVISALAPVGAMVGFLVGGVIVDVGGPEWNFRTNFLTYLISATLIALIVVRPRIGHEPKSTTPLATPAKHLDSFAAGFTYVATHQRVLQMILLGALFWGVSGVVYSVVPAFVVKLTQGDYTTVGTFRALPAVGMLAGAALMALLGNRLGVRGAVLIGLAGAGSSLAFLAAAFYRSWSGASAMTLLVLLGVAGSMLLVTIMSSLQRFTPNTRRGRVFGVSDMTTMGAMVLATGLLGLPKIPGLDRYVPLLLLLTAAGMLGALVVAAYIYRRNARKWRLLSPTKMID